MSTNPIDTHQEELEVARFYYAFRLPSQKQDRCYDCTHCTGNDCTLIDIYINNNQLSRCKLHDPAQPSDRRARSDPS